MSNTPRLQLLLRLLRKTNWPLVFGTVGLAVLLLLAVFGPTPAPMDPLEGHKGELVSGQRLPPYPPSERFPLGTDRLGRDIPSGLLAGARYTLLFTGLALAVGLVAAVPVGLYAGWRGGTTGAVVEVLSGGVAAVPQVLLVGLALRAIRGPTFEGAVLVQTAASALVLGLLAVLALIHISIVPYLLIEIPYFPWFEAHPVYPEWTTYMTMPFADLSLCYWVLLYPGLAISILVFHLLVDGLRRRWSHLHV